MKLVTTLSSPYGRKVQVVAAEAGLSKHIEIVLDNPWKPETHVPELNPIGKVPVLIVDDGEYLYDSVVISEYLDSLHDGVKLLPLTGPARWSALRRQTLADHLLDAFITVRLERNRPSDQQSQGWISRKLTVVQRCLDAMDNDTPSASGGVTIGHIAYGVALGHLDFRRLPSDPDWRDCRQRLTFWYKSFSLRPSMGSTTPSD